MSKTLNDGEWELDGVLFGTGHHDGYPYSIMSGGDITDGMAVRNQDVASPRDDLLRFGRDHLTPPERHFVIKVDNRDGRKLAELRTLWRADGVRLNPAAVSTLRWRLNGVTYRASGRPRDFAVVVNDPPWPERVIVHASFQYRDPHAYVDDERSVSMTIYAPIVGTGMTLPAVLPWTLGDAPDERVGVTEVNSTAPAPFMVRITGPVYGSASRIRVWGSGWELGFGSLALLPGQTITVDTRDGSALLNGSSIAGRLSARSTLRARLQPGTESFRFAAADPSASTRVTVSWRDPISIF